MFQINWVFHAFFMTFFFVLALVLFLRGRRHSSTWTKHAKAMNLIFQDKGGRLHQPLLSRFRLLGASVVDEPTEMLSGKWLDRELLAFNWFFQSATGFNALRAGFICLVVKLKSPRVRLLAFDRTLAPFSDPAGESVIVLDSEPFGERYAVFCKNRKGADALLNPAVSAFLMTEGPLWLEVDEDCLMLAWQGAFEPDDFPKALERLARLLEIMGEIPHVKRINSHVKSEN